MNKYLVIFICIFLVKCTTTPEKAHPVIQKQGAVEDYHGMGIEDPYRNLENIEDTAVLSYLKLQEEFTTYTLDKQRKKETITTARDRTEAVNQPKTGKIRITKNRLYFYLKRNPEETFPKLYYRNGFDGEETLLLDPSSQEFGEEMTISFIRPNWDGSKVAFGLTRNDREFCKLRVLDVASKTVLPGFADHALPNSLGGVEWLPDGTGFIYTYLPVIDSKDKGYLLNSKAVLYLIENNRSVDIFSKENNPNISFQSEDFPITNITSETSNYLLASIAGVSRYRDTYVASIEDLKTGTVSWKKLYGKEDKIIQFSIEGDDLYFRSSKSASNFELYKVSLRAPDFSNPEMLVRADSIASITDFALANNTLFYATTKNGVEANMFMLKDQVTQKIALPKPSGYLSIITNGIEGDGLWIETEGWISKPERYTLDFANYTFREENMSPVQRYEELQDVVVEEIEITSHDGTKVPLSLVYNKNIDLNKENPLLLKGYGAYGISDTPYLDPYLLPWIQHGGIYAVAHVRGGGEKGDAWYKGGFKNTKSNTWKDFIACTEYLIDGNYTNPKKIIAMSSSAGGVLVGRAITERPDLYAGAVIRVGLLNPLRLEAAPNGLNNAKEFGSVKDSLEFQALLEMDPYHSIKEGASYPAIYLTAGINDARIPAWQPAKFAARMQEANTSRKPVLISIDFEGGHGTNASKDKAAQELEDILTFALWQVGHPDYQGKD